MDSASLQQPDLPFLLAPTVTPGPLTSAQLKLNYPSLIDISNIQIQQALVLHDLFSILTGLEGNYIRYSDPYSTALSSEDKEVKINALLNGPDFKLSKSLNPSLKDLTKDIVKLGKIYSSLNHFVQFFDNSYFGKINQNLSWFIRNYLKNYLLKLNQMLKKFKYSSTDSSSYNILLLLNDLKANNIDLKLKILYEICHLIYSDSKKRSFIRSNDFNQFISTLKSDFYKTSPNTDQFDLSFDNSKFQVCKGGLPLKIINKQMIKNQGNPEIFQFLSSLFDDVSKNYLIMLNQWLINGIIDDPFQEFLIKLNDLNYDQNNNYFSSKSPLLDNLSKSLEFKKNNNSTNHSIKMIDRYWDTKFSIRKDGLPKQLDESELRNKILLTGTYLNIVKDCGILIPYTELREEEIFNINSNKNYIKSLTNINLLNIQVDHWYSVANDQILNLFYQGYDFLNIFKDFENYFFQHNFGIIIIANILNSNLLTLRSNINSNSSNSFYLFELQKDFQDYSNELSSASSFVNKFGKLKFDQSSIFQELEAILNVQPINPEGIFNSSSYQALQTIVKDSIITNVPNSSSSNNHHVSFDDYLINYLTIDLTLPFPINLIISHTEFTKYQIIFRWLLVNNYFIKLLEENYTEIQFYFKKTFSRRQLSKLSIINYKYLSLLKNVYNQYQLVIVDTFNLIFDKLSNRKLTFEETQKQIQDMLDTMLLNMKLTEDGYLKLSKGYFKRVVNFFKFSKKYLNNANNNNDELDEIFYKFFEEIKKFQDKFNDIWK